jgi:4-hydroxybenzoate polyprenyltransferase
MNLKVKAASYTAGFFAIVFIVMSAINYVAGTYAPLVIGLGLCAYLIYLMYEIKLGQLKYEQETKTDQ